MATGLSNKLTGAIGEYLVAAELCRRGYIATTFTGNVPHYDIVASDAKGRHVAIQVKTTWAKTWHANILSFCDVTLDSRTKKQTVGRKKRSPVKNLVCVFVKLGRDKEDRYFVCTWNDLRDTLVRRHKTYLQKHGGRRPVRWDSLHIAASIRRLEPFEDNWRLIKKSLH